MGTNARLLFIASQTHLVSFELCLEDRRDVDLQLDHDADVLVLKQAVRVEVGRDGAQDPAQAELGSRILELR